MVFRVLASSIDGLTFAHTHAYSNEWRGWSDWYATHRALRCYTRVKINFIACVLVIILSILCVSCMCSSEQWSVFQFRWLNCTCAVCVCVYCVCSRFTVAGLAADHAISPQPASADVEVQKSFFLLWNHHSIWLKNTYTTERTNITSVYISSHAKRPR